MVVTAEDRQALFDWTRRLVLHMGYRGAGTIEGLRSRDGSYFFMEINARLQVEHPVTEFLTGMDIVESQLRIASGEELRHSQDEIPMRGHAVEARVYAEDPETFFPSPGTITALDLPQEDEHLRIEHAIHAQGVVPPYYDPLLAKVITWDVTRNGAVERLTAALKSIRIEGVKTTIPTSLKILEHPMFRNGDFDTGSLEEWLAKK
jgi:acetyl-CoA carboxylase biotin carboxylase subunit